MNSNIWFRLTYVVRTNGTKPKIEYFTNFTERYHENFPLFHRVAIFMVNFSGIFARPKYVPFEPQEEKEYGGVNVVTGQYSYIDPTGALVTVTYTAGPDGYTEDRTVQEGFLSKGLRASKEPSNPELNPNDEEKGIEERKVTSMNIQRLKNDLKILLECQALKKVDRSLTDGPCVRFIFGMNQLFLKIT